ncbi:hypothetical protein CBOM_00337 [Ceraceosorus bombacis]|uniref:Acyl-CoA thioesterase-like N-terminal HotDog domain-containing protein n=1 Tax=Ceraceosorus bombacis TaxID=401625 RepID=A0A0P1B8Q9_9BASI|nr:hypothetical protein CBOM_00337 [Ceraceosorus bombacis]
MAPLTTSLDVQLRSEAENGSAAIYSGRLDQEVSSAGLFSSPTLPTKKRKKMRWLHPIVLRLHLPRPTSNGFMQWTIGSVPNGGYSLSAIINAAQAFQRSEKQKSAHVDPFHCAATYLAAAQAGSHEVHLTVLKKGRGFTNLEGKLVQRAKDGKNTTRIVPHLIMTSFAARESDRSLDRYTIRPGNKFHVSCPISPFSRCQGPSKAFQTEKMSMRNRLVVYTDKEQNKKAREEGRLAWGAWMDARNEDERHKTRAGVSNNVVAL